MNILHIVQLSACAALVAASSTLALADDSRAGGAYLTGGAGQCSDCHGAGLRGGPNPIPGPPGAPWAKTVPSLHGLKMFKTNADAIAFLHTTTLPGGGHALGPMPRYMFSLADATTIVTYLRALK